MKYAKLARSVLFYRYHAVRLLDRIDIANLAWLAHAAVAQALLEMS
jgi:hypothetical protein